MAIIIVGSLNMDLIVRTPRIPAAGETILGHAFATAPGGKGANQAVAAAKLGAPVKMIGRLGTDEFGKTLRSQRRAVGVDTQFVADDAEAATGVALISVDDNGQNSIIVAPGANARVTCWMWMPHAMPCAKPSLSLPNWKFPSTLPHMRYASLTMPEPSPF